MAQNVIRFYIFDKDELSGTLIENYLKKVNFPYQIYKFNDFNIDIIKKNNEYFKFIFVDVSKKNTEIFDKISECSSDIRNIFFMMCDEPETDLYIKALRVGAKEFLKKPLEKDSFIASIFNNYNENMLEKGKIIKQGSRIIASTSFEKNCGKTFFAINVAAELAFVAKERVLLIDFNDNLNNITFSLDLDQEFDTGYFIENLTAENAKTILPKVYKYKNLPLYIMSSCMYKTQIKPKLGSDNIQQFLDTLKKYFRYIVIDVNNDAERTNKTIFSNTDMIFYLISPNIAANARNKNHIDINFDKKKFRIILNKYRDKDESKLTEIEGILGREIFYKIPVNLSVTLGAGVKGKTIREINENLDILTKYNKLAKYIISRV